MFCCLLNEITFVNTVSKTKTNNRKLAFYAATINCLTDPRS